MNNKRNKQNSVMVASRKHIQDGEIGDLENVLGLPSRTKLGIFARIWRFIGISVFY